MTVYIEDSFAGSERPLTHGRICYQREAGTITTSGAAAGFPAVNAGTLRTDSGWRPDALPATWVLTFAAPAVVSYIGIAKHDLGSLGAVFSLEYDIGAGFVAYPGMSGRTATDDKPILFLALPRAVDAIRLTVTSADAVPTISVISAGEADEMPRPFVWTGQPITEGEQIAYEDTRSQTGNWLGRSVQSQGLQFSLTMQNVSEAWRQTTWAAFKVWANGEGAAFFIAARPGGYPDEVAFAWTNQNPRANRSTPNKAISTEISLNCQGLLTYGG